MKYFLTGICVMLVEVEVPIVFKIYQLGQGPFDTVNASKC